MRWPFMLVKNHEFIAQRMQEHYRGVFFDQRARYQQTIDDNERVIRHLQDRVQHLQWILGEQDGASRR